MGGWVAAAGGGSQVDVVARVVGVIGLIVAIAAIAMDWYLWRRSGPEILVLLRRPGQGERWEGVDVVNPGRMPVVIREAGVMVLDRQTRKLVSQPLDPVDGEFPVKVPPTGCVLMPWAGKHGDEVVGYAIRGDGKTFHSSKAVSW